MERYKVDQEDGGTYYNLNENGDMIFWFECDKFAQDVANKLNSQAKKIERLEAENKLYKKSNDFYVDTKNWSCATIQDYNSHIKESDEEWVSSLDNLGGKLARETAKKIEAIRREK